MVIPRKRADEPALAAQKNTQRNSMKKIIKSGLFALLFASAAMAVADDGKLSLEMLYHPLKKENSIPVR
jgi:hypothetical protein